MKLHLKMLNFYFISSEWTAVKVRDFIKYEFQLQHDYKFIESVRLKMFFLFMVLVITMHTKNMRVN